ncbi:hypothetical protein P3T29_005262 [Kitasatospora sp. MAP5-34]|nr:hypothetical protein [Kitasatospora sp. MAP5-34]
MEPCVPQVTLCPVVHDAMQVVIRLIARRHR